MEISKETLAHLKTWQDETDKMTASERRRYHKQIPMAVLKEVVDLIRASKVLNQNAPR